MYTHTYPREPRLDYLKEALGVDNVSGLEIFDMGGNNGNLLRDGIETYEIHPENYTCMDIDSIVMSKCRAEFKDATWLTRPLMHPLYDYYAGDDDYDFLKLNEKFDVIFAYSVYSHSSHESMHRDLDLMYKCLKPQGKMCISFIDTESVMHFITKRLHEYGTSVEYDAFKNVSDYTYFINNDVITKEYEHLSSIEYFLNVYNPEWLQQDLESKYQNCIMTTGIFQPNFVITRT